jgi:hypothetical protein
VSGRSGNFFAGHHEHNLYARCADNPSCDVRDYDLCSHSDPCNSIIGNFVVARLRNRVAKKCVNTPSRVRANYPYRAWRVGVKISGVGEAAQNNAVGNKLRRNSLLYRSQRIDTYCPKYGLSSAERESRQPQDFGRTRCPYSSTRPGSNISLDTKMDVKCVRS